MLPLSTFQLWNVKPVMLFSSVAQSCPTLCDPMDRSMSGLPVHHQFPRACSDSCPLSLWCHPTISSSVVPFSSFNLSQHQGVFQWVSSSHQVAKVLELQLQHHIQDWFPLGWTAWISLQSKGISRVFYNTTVQKLQFFDAQPSLWSNSHIYTWLLEKP